MSKKTYCTVIISFPSMGLMTMTFLLIVSVFNCSCSFCLAFSWIQFGRIVAFCAAAALFLCRCWHIANFNRKLISPVEGLAMGLCCTPKQEGFWFSCTPKDGAWKRLIWELFVVICLPPWLMTTSKNPETGTDVSCLKWQRFSSFIFFDPFFCFLR